MTDPSKSRPVRGESAEDAQRAQALRRLIELLAERVARRLLDDASATQGSRPSRHHAD